METIRELLTDDHRQCDDLFAVVEQAVAAGDWDKADAAFARFCAAMLNHFDIEEATLFPEFEARTGMTMGPVPGFPEADGVPWSDSSISPAI